MNSVGAIFIKQSQDIFKNKGVLIQFIIFPVIAFLMINVVDEVSMGMDDNYFVTMFATMFVGMSLISTVSAVIAEDREKKSLRFLMMAGVKSHQYLLGIGGFFLVCAIIVSILFTTMMYNFPIIEKLTFLGSLMLGSVASILWGAIIGMIVKNEQAAISLGTTVGMIMGFGPMVATFNETIANVFRIFYTMNFIYTEEAFQAIINHLSIMMLNIAVLAVVFVWIYRKRGLTS